MLAKNVRRRLRKRLRKLFICVSDNRKCDEMEQAEENIYGGAVNGEYQAIYENISAFLISAVLRKQNEIKQKRVAIFCDPRLMSEYADNSLDKFALLPDLPLLKVFSYLKGAQILQLRFVCKRWHSLILSAANQLPKFHMDFSLVITENPYAQLCPESCATAVTAKSSFLCHLESMREVETATPHIGTNLVGEKVSPKQDLMDEDGVYFSLYSYPHFKIKRINFRDCTPSAELLEKVGMALRGKRPSMLRFDHCILRSEIESALINLLREWKDYLKIIVLKGCYDIGAISDNLIKELDQVEQFFVDPNQQSALSSVTDTALDSIAANFKIQPFHLTLPSSGFTEIGVQEFLKAISYEDYNIPQHRFSMRESARYQRAPLSNATVNDLHMIWKLTPSMLTISPSCLTPISICPDYEKNASDRYCGPYGNFILDPLIEFYA